MANPTIVPVDIQGFSGSIPGLPVSTANSVSTLTQTVVHLTANTSTSLVGANASRQYLAFQVIDVGAVNLGIGGAAVVGQGWALDPAAGAGLQGGAIIWEGNIITQQAFQGISSVNTTVVVWEGV